MAFIFSVFNCGSLVGITVNTFIIKHVLYVYNLTLGLYSHDRIALKFDKHIDSAAAEMPVKS